jgi:malate/lactate dehydrogenase
MFYYIYKEKLLISSLSYSDVKGGLKENFKEILEEEARGYRGKIFALNPLNPEVSRRSFLVTHKEFLFIKKEDLNLLKTPQSNKENLSQYYKEDIPEWLTDAIDSKRVISLNPYYSNWEEVLNYMEPKKWRVNVVGLGDVGGTLLTGLKLLGYEKISQLGLYDRDENKVNRWKFELGQILSPDMKERNIDVIGLKEDEVFNCDMFVFCVSVGVPEVGKEGEDVRLVQFKGNAKILGNYAKVAREKAFKGIFAVVSDPVDLLCRTAFEESNKDKEGTLDFKGLAPEQIRGYGLGVMNGRASYYANEKEETKQYTSEGRAFGPHGEGLIIADSIVNYNEKLSEELTEKTKTANLDIRGTGFKPYIAPALSSGSLSLLATINSQWHYSATFIGGTFMGCRNRFAFGCTEIETLEFPEKLFSKLEDTYNLLDKLYKL